MIETDWSQIVLVIASVLLIGYALINLRELWKERIDDAEAKVSRIRAELSDLKAYRVCKVDFSNDLLIKTWVSGSSVDDIAWMCDWIYIVNIVALVAEEEPVWRSLFIDAPSKEDIARLAREIRECDKSRESVCQVFTRAFGTANAPFVNLPFREFPLG